jgi:hypothetical protein
MADAARATGMPNKLNPQGGLDEGAANDDWLDNAVATPTDDGGMVLSAPQDEAPSEVPFDGNLALLMTEQERQSLALRIIDTVERDERSRKPWKDTYARGLDLLGLVYEERTQPWENACGAFHPMLLESVIRFNAQEMSDLFPGSGPVNTKVVGRMTDDKQRQSNRVKADLNNILLRKMKGFRDETDMLMFALPFVGCGFRKWRFDTRRKLPAAEYILAEHVVIPYFATSLESAPRFCVYLNKTRQWIEQQQRRGRYLDVRVGDGIMVRDQISDKRDDIKGQTPPVDARDYTHRLYEEYIHLDLQGIDTLVEDGEEAPYVVTVDSVSYQLLGIYRDWKQGDPLQERQRTVTHYKYMPGFGPYGMGLMNILGSLTESATSILRQLVDAGTLANLPAGYKTKQARIKGDSAPIAPGDWRDVDLAVGELKNAFYPLPYKEPSTVLYQLLGNVVDEGRRIGSVADLKITDMTGQNMPVGTTLAIIERSMKVMSGVQQRVYAAAETEYNICAEIVRDFMGQIPYDFELEPQDQQATREADYNEMVGIVPVADPNATTMAQRIMVNQAIIQLTGQAPQIYNLKEVHRAMISSLGSEESDRFIPPDSDVQPADPVTENARLINNLPVAAGPAQDHDAHIAVHMAAINDPNIASVLGKSPLGPSIMAAAAAHIQEHLAFQYRDQIEQQMGVQLPPPDQPLPDDVEYNLSSVVARAADKLLGKHQAEAKAAEILDHMQDPVVQAQQRQLDQDQQKIDNRHMVDMAKLDQAGQQQVWNLIQTLIREKGNTLRTAITAEGNQKAALTDQETRAAEIAAELAGTIVESAASVDAARAKGSPSSG